MQNALINVNERDLGNGSVQTVNARDLHAFLEVGKVFAAWIKERIEQYGFADGTDYVTFENLSFPKSESAKARPQRIIEYALTLDMAKELAMVERNEKGKQARQYFIECERKAKTASIDPMQLLNDPTALRGLLSNYSEKVVQLETQVQTLEPKAAALDRIATANGSICVTDAAKALQLQPSQLFLWLQQHEWIYKRTGKNTYTGYQARIKQGYLEHKVETVHLQDGTERIREQVRITPLGLAKLSSIFETKQAA